MNLFDHSMVGPEATARVKLLVAQPPQYGHTMLLGALPDDGSPACLVCGLVSCLVWLVCFPRLFGLPGALCCRTGGTRLITLNVMGTAVPRPTFMSDHLYGNDKLKMNSDCWLKSKLHLSVLSNLSSPTVSSMMRASGQILLVCCCWTSGVSPIKAERSVLTTMMKTG